MDKYDYFYEPGTVICDMATNKYYVVLKYIEKFKKYSCLNYNMNVIYINADDARKINMSYALYKVMYDIKSAENGDH